MGPGDQAGVMVATSKYKGVLANVILVLGVWLQNVLLQVLLNQSLMVVMTQTAQMMSQPTCSVMSLHSLEKSMDTMNLTWDWVPNLLNARRVSAAQSLQGQAMLVSTFVESLNVHLVHLTQPLKHLMDVSILGGPLMISAMMKIMSRNVTMMVVLAAKKIHQNTGITTALFVNV